MFSFSAPAGAFAVWPVFVGRDFRAHRPLVVIRRTEAKARAAVRVETARETA